MNNLEIYKQKLTKTINQLNQYDSNKLDSDYKVLKEAFDLSYENEIFKLYNIDSKELDQYRLEFFRTITQKSGTLAFLAIQIFAANAIMNKNNFHKKDEYFNKKCGIAINHLRSEKTVVSAIKCEGGYKLNGTLTWASGYKIFDNLLIGFHYEDSECEVLAPFEEQKGFHIGIADDTFVGYGLYTVNITLDDFFVKEENIVSFNKIGNYTKNKSVSKTVHMCLYAIGYASMVATKDDDIKSFANKKLEAMKNIFMSSKSVDEMDNLRVELFEFIQKLITTAMVVKGGSSILFSSDLQRYYKELIMFNANGLNQKLKDISKSNFLK